MNHHERVKSGSSTDINNDSILKEELNHFSIGLIILEKIISTQKYKIKLMNSFAYEIFELKKTFDFLKVKEQMIEFKKWENNNLLNLNLYQFIFSNHITNEISGTFISSISMIYVKVKFFQNEIFISIDNYNDERKELQGNILKILKYQYLVTLYHELNNPLNGLINISDLEIIEYNKITLVNLKAKLSQINLLVILIKTFIKNFIWYFTVIFEISNNKKIAFNSKINLEYIFSKVVQKFIVLFKYKEISYDSNFSFLNDKYILSNERHLKNFIRGIFNYIYRNIQKKNGYKITCKLKNENKIKINFIKKTKIEGNTNLKKSPSLEKRSKIIDDVLFNHNNEFDFSNSVQTNEMTKDFLIKLGNLLKIHIIIYNESDEKLITLILPFTKENEEKEESLYEFTLQQKNTALDAINRQICLCEKLQSLVFEKNNNINYDIIDSSTSHFENLKTPKKNYLNSIIFDPNQRNQNKTQSSKTVIGNNFYSEPKDIKKLEDDPFIKIIKEINFFSNQITQSKDFDESNDSFHIIKNKKNYSCQELKTYSLDNYNNEKKKSLLKKLIKENKEKDNIIIKKKFRRNDKRKSSFQKIVVKSTTVENNNFQLVNPEIKIIVNNITNEKDNNDNFQINKKNLKILHKKNLSNLDNPKIKLCNCNDVLICDDETFNLNTIKNMLQKFNINSDISSNGKECLDLIIKKNKINCVCDKRDYKILFLDMMMPVMNGLEAAKKIQEMINKKEINDNLKIIIVSAHIEENLLKNLKEIKSIVEEIPKPLKKNKMEEILNHYYFNNN